MKIVRFDAEVSVPVSRFGSRFKVGPLTGPGANAQVQVVHLPAGGLVGRHEAPVRQLFAVVAGSGWASGQEGRRRNLGAGYAAVWDQGEDHEAGSDAGLTAVWVEGNFNIVALAVTQDIVVSDYDPEWPRTFEEVRAQVWPTVEDIALGIDHVGSTAVPGLAAKPIIDMDIVVASEEDVAPVIERLAGIGYGWQGDLGVVGREAFSPPAGTNLPSHHLYLVVKDNRAHLDHWLLRDLLRADAAARESYSALKRQNVQVAQGDMDVYLAAKAELVAGLLRQARAERGLPPVTYWEPDALG
jgi:GrpB-like predicted nucleotidyltransferase (UPF0157 family)/quercetin dioxygenase-like cupin family protein